MEGVEPRFSMSWGDDSTQPRFSVDGFVDEDDGRLRMTLDDAWQDPGDPPSVDMSKDRVAELIGELVVMWRLMP